MKSGWINVSGIWYYLLETHNGSYGAMAKGWYQENGIILIKTVVQCK